MSDVTIKINGKEVSVPAGSTILDAAKKLKNRNAERARKLGIEYLKDKGINIDNKK